MQFMPAGALEWRQRPNIAGATGKVLGIARGDELGVRVVNDLAEPTSVHWHGVRLPNAMDGVPGLTQAPIAPGTTFDYRFRPPDAGTFWYHAHIGAQVDRGLYAALIVEEARPVDVDRGIVLMFAVSAGAGGSPAPVLVNGSPRPDVPVRSGERLRLRLIDRSSVSFFTIDATVILLSTSVCSAISVQGPPPLR